MYLHATEVENRKKNRKNIKGVTGREKTKQKSKTKRGHGYGNLEQNDNWRVNGGERGKLSTTECGHHKDW